MQPQQQGRHTKSSGTCELECNCCSERCGDFFLASVKSNSGYPKISLFHANPMTFLWFCCFDNDVGYHTYPHPTSTPHEPLLLVHVDIVFPTWVPIKTTAQQLCNYFLNPPGQQPFLVFSKGDQGGTYV